MSASVGDTPATPDEAGKAGPRRGARPGRLRWAIAGCLALGVFISYLDRANLSVANGDVRAEFGLTNGEMGIVLSAFAWSYTLFTLPVAALLDRIGIVWIQRVGAFIYSAATLLTSVVSGFGLLIAVRVLLGVGEAPIFPSASKATSYWFPVRERSVATSCFDGAAKFANVVGVPLMSVVISLYGWRAAFIFSGGLSVLYLVVFWAFYRDPSKHRRLREPERRYLRDGGAQQENTASSAGVSARALLSRRKVWGLILGFTAYNYCFTMFMTWLPGYLSSTMGMSLLKSGGYTAIPWIAATITDVAIGGYLVDRLIRNGRNSTMVRQVALCGGMVLGLAVLPAAFTTNPTVAITCITIALAGIALSAPVAWSIPGLIAPAGSIGLLGGVMNFGGNVASIVAPIVTGYVADAAGFGTAFLIAGVVLALGLLAYALLLGRIEPVLAEAPTDSKVRA